MARRTQSRKGTPCEGLRVSRKQNSRLQAQRFRDGLLTGSLFHGVDVSDTHTQGSGHGTQETHMAMLRIIPSAGLQAEPSSAGSHSLQI